MMERLRPLGITMALLVAAAGFGIAGTAVGCKGGAELSVGTPPPPPPPPPPADDDGDGIANDADKCPQEKEDGLAPDPQDGCPNLDPDNDGIKGDADKCPNEPETFNEFEDEDGCPDKKPLVEVRGREIKINDKILFETNSAKIDEKSNELIESIANVIKKHPEIQFIEIAGHADKRGSAALNKNLTQQRAKAVMDALVKLGVDPTRVRAVGYGSYCPLDPGDSEEALDKNRRVEFKILRRDGKDTDVSWGGCDDAKAKGMAPQPIPANAPSGPVAPAAPAAQ